MVLLEGIGILGIPIPFFMPSDTERIAIDMAKFGEANSPPETGLTPDAPEVLTLTRSVGKNYPRQSTQRSAEDT